MKIASSNIGMESARSYRASTATVRRFSIMDYRQSLTQSGNALNTAVKGESRNAEQNESQTAGQQRNTGIAEWQNRFGMPGNITVGRTRMRNADSSILSDIQQMTIRYIFDMLFSARRNRWRDYAGGNSAGNSTENVTNQANQANQGAANANGQQNVQVLFLNTGLNVLNSAQGIYQMEEENTGFSTVGTVRTSDGREINFNVNVGMSREFEEYYKEDLQQLPTTMCDPLVINMDTDVAQLSDQTFFFDIDADGEQDEISQLGSGSGYLALDKNGDGIINDGSELFGTSSGNGFADLARYDEDGNGWIDENDAIWSKLKIWAKDANGKDVLYRLADKGVGAICLQNADTDFTLKGSAGQTQGAIRRTGVFLYENGNVGTIQHVDVAKYYKEA